MRENSNKQLHRRDVLGMMAGLGLSLSLPGLSPKAAAARREERPKSLITLWMDGGMSQLETWDPHAGTPSGGEVKSIATSLPGLQISDFMPQMAEQMHDVTLIRSLTSLEGDHARGAAYVKTGYRLEPTLIYPSLGAIAAHQLRDPKAEIPQHVSLAGDNFFPRGGYLGNKWDAFRVFDPGRSLTNLKASVSDQRQRQRMKGLDVVSGQFTKARPTADRDTLHADTVRRALTMMSSEQLKAFELDDEPAVVKAAYGDTRFGRGCLVARRLVETGVRAIEVALSGFDTHVNNHAGQKTQADILDPAFAMLLTDLRERDLLDSTIVLCITEFGRTPGINPAGGRDHWPHWFSCVAAGGGFRSGLVVGETPAAVFDGKAKPKPKDPITIPQLYATIMKSMGIAWDDEIITPIGRPIRFADAEPEDRLLA
ncbi:DUF1501 domain-containing protein [Fuerstiella marisgermanici]|uniref:DUF1501 domain-containing protein n=1 Tax=Fuerstiella marisgermanici TaxID=1891926 RepID=A0A1P8WQ56_9PLAN|nr:DUF1501 domain-containing protein [Fuerstiella marisgermanici]APZ96193.1 hypothetical protein Fuma_05861 [Fuerstiella marisgermanici]